MLVDDLNLIVCGVGGQGVVLSSDILANAFLKSGYDVKATDIIGLGQRGGSVVTHVRAGEKVISPLIKKGEADILLSFEKYEALRWSRYLKEEGLLIVNDKKVTPTSVTEKLQDDIDLDRLLGELDYERMIIDISSILRDDEISSKYTNTFMLGMLSMKTSIESRVWEESIGENVTVGFREDNIKAFRVGRKLFQMKAEEN
ncbi:MAG: indolepyruvate oxidoreductase subunit beta [Clostridia bacterium]|nr:indolepyruvate oxidoreductase subunit beta [Clostridia bacterium]